MPTYAAYRKQVPYLLLALCICAADQISKAMIEASLHLLEVRPLTAFFNIVYYRNTGSAFGMFKQLGNTFFIIVSCLAILVVFILMLRDEQNRPGMACILGGAAGNLTDRIVHKYVIDFLEVHAGKHYWPAFNIADSALTIGMGLLLINAWIHRKDM
ncbi:MAG: signal peptidase II [Thermodesulfovibrio sp.]|nr:signal peptidase II [Thermodesulfovibrio sp.]